jgi:hypothetical protein
VSLLRHQHPSLMLGRRPLVGVMPAFGALGTFNASAASTSCAPTYPAGVLINDICFLIAGSDNDSAITCPAGWQPVGPGQVAVDADYSAALFWRRLDGTESGAITVTRAASTPASSFFGARTGYYRGCVPNGLPYEGLATTTGTSTTATGPGLVTYGVNRLALQFFAWGNGGASTAPGGWTVTYQVNSTTGNDGSISHERLAAATPRTIAAPARTLTGTEPFVAFGLSLLPA